MWKCCGRPFNSSWGPRTMQFKLEGRAENWRYLAPSILYQRLGAKAIRFLDSTPLLQLHRSRGPEGVAWPAGAFLHHQLPMQSIRNVSGHSRSHITKSVENSLFSPYFPSDPSWEDEVRKSSVHHYCFPADVLLLFRMNTNAITKFNYRNSQFFSC